MAGQTTPTPGAGCGRSAVLGALARAIAFPRRVVIIMADLPNINATTLRRASREGEALPTWPSV